MMSIHYPKVTIAIPTRNRSIFLCDAIISALSQTYANIEVIVSDNASSDDTGRLVSTFDDSRLIYVRQVTNIGMMGNWDACLNQATGDYFILLSDDDVLMPHAVEEMVSAYMFSDPVESEEIGMVYCGVELIDQYGSHLRNPQLAPAFELSIDTIHGFFRSKRPTYPCAIMLRTNDLYDLGGYSKVGFELTCDARAWMSICLLRGKVRFIKHTLARYRIHGSSLTAQSTVYSWLENNRSLANYCGDYLKMHGDIGGAVKIHRACEILNIRTAAALIGQQKYSLGLMSAVTNYIRCRAYFGLRNNSLYFLYYLFLLVVPGSSLRMVRHMFSLIFNHMRCSR